VPQARPEPRVRRGLREALVQLVLAQREPPDLRVELERLVRLVRLELPERPERLVRLVDLVVPVPRERLELLVPLERPVQSERP